MIQKFRTLASDERGSSLIEFALALPLFAAFLMGMVDLSRAYSERLQLEQSTQRAIEKVMNNQTGSTSYNTLKAEAATAAGVAQSAVTVSYWLECNGTKQSNYDSACTSGQTYARYLNVSVTKAFTPTFGTKYFPGANSDGTYTLKADAGIRTQ